MKLIHHYTNVDILALILKNKTIRFNRLDQVDDITEAHECSGIKFGQYFFVSSWTTDKEESIPQWHMYTKSMSGIRISLPEYPFKKEKLEAPAEWDIIQEGEILSPIPFNKLITDEYFIPPIFLSPNQFSDNIDYVDNIEDEYKKSVDLKTSNNNQTEIKINNIGRLARLKKKAWKFQNEYRFLLFILPAIELPPKGLSDENYIKELPNHIVNCFVRGVPPNISYFDVEIDQEVLDEIIITLGPLCNEGNKAIVEALISKYSKNGKVVESKLTGTIRNTSK